MSASGQRLRLAIMFDNFGPYHIARMVAASAHSDVIALEVSPHSAEYDWERPALPEHLTHLPLQGYQGTATLEKFLEKQLAPLSPHAFAIPGWSSRPSLEVARWCSKRRIPTILMSESNRWDFQRLEIKERFKRAVIKHFSSALTSSSSQSAYLASLGMPANSIFLGYNVVDNNYFRERASMAATEAMPLVDGSHLPAQSRDRYFLTVSRFVQKKNLERLLEAYCKFRVGRTRHPADWPLVILGDGELRAKLEGARTRLGLDLHVHMPGFLQIDEIPTFYGTAGAFILPSTTEQWGLVVNEAMASGLPVAVSRRCGCAEDLIDNGDTGLLFDPFRVDDIARVLRAISEPAERQRLAQNARVRISLWGPHRFGQGIHQAMKHAITVGAATPGWRDRSALAIAAAMRKQ